MKKKCINFTEIEIFISIKGPKVFSNMWPELCEDFYIINSELSSELSRKIENENNK